MNLDHGHTEDKNSADGCLCECEENWTIESDCSVPRPCERVTDCNNSGNYHYFLVKSFVFDFFNFKAFKDKIYTID